MIRGRHSLLQKARFYSSVVLLNVATLFLFGSIFQPFGLLRPDRPIFAKALAIPAQPLAAPLRVPIIGKPTRIEIIGPDNGLHIDLPVKDGAYNPASNNWTLDQHSAFFALPSMLANDIQGTTLIYGHNEAQVFGYLSAIHQGVGAYALVYTDTGKVFRYTYQDATNLKPDDVSVFNDTGKPTLIVQTCSGSWFELRRMYRFSFDKLETPA